MSVAIEAKPAFTAAKPRLLFEGPYVGGHPSEGGNYDVAPDGQRFVMIEEVDPLVTSRINIVANWFEELKRLVPTN
jgi:hypothetical protein